MQSTIQDLIEANGAEKLQQALRNNMLTITPRYIMPEGSLTLDSDNGYQLKVYVHPDTHYSFLLACGYSLIEAACIHGNWWKQHLEQSVTYQCYTATCDTERPAFMLPELGMGYNQPTPPLGKFIDYGAIYDTHLRFTENAYHGIDALNYYLKSRKTVKGGNIFAGADYPKGADYGPIDGKEARIISIDECGTIDYEAFKRLWNGDRSSVIITEAMTKNITWLEGPDVTRVPPVKKFLGYEW